MRILPVLIDILEIIQQFVTFKINQDINVVHVNFANQRLLMLLLIQENFR